MALDYNPETNDQHNVVETRVEVPLNGGTFTFTQPLARYIHDKLTPEDWNEIGMKIRANAESAVRRLVLSGLYFRPNGLDLARSQILSGCRAAFHETFKRRMVAAGDLAWSAPSCLLGERYK